MQGTLRVNISNEQETTTINFDDPQVVEDEITEKLPQH